MERLNGETLDIVQDNIQKLKQIFPEVFNEDKVDMEKLETLLSNDVDQGTERFNFTWPGKSQSIRIAQTPSTGTLRPCREESKNWDTTENLYIEGDNLEVLKLLQKSYYNKVKMIYIDPPYNTGKDFVYKDNFKDNIENYLEVTGQKDEAGNKLTTNTETSGRYHSNWLNMMYPRLRLARNLLTDDGVIFMSIDEAEVHNLRKIGDEIFGETNYVGEIIRKTKSMTGDDGNGFNTQHEYLLIFAKNKTLTQFIGELKDYSKYSNPDNDSKGVWITGDPSAKSGGPTTYFGIENPYTKKVDFPPTGRYWAFSKRSLEEYINTGKIIFKKNHNVNERGFIFKRYKSDRVSQHNPINSLFGIENEYMNQSGTIEVKKIFDDDLFSYPKPVSFIEKLIVSITNSEDIILDFFSGSATTAHAVIKTNMLKEKKRKFILIQLPELQNNQFRNICEIGKERIRRAGDKIVADNKDKEGIESLDIGFKVFKLDSSNIKKWDSTYEQDLQQTLESSVENIKTGRSEEDLLYEVLLKYGIDLNVPIEEFILAGKKVFNIGFGALIVCLDKEISFETIQKIGELKQELDPEACQVVFMDSGFETDALKTNAMQTLKRFGIEDVKSI